MCLVGDAKIWWSTLMEEVVYSNKASRLNLGCHTGKVEKLDPTM